VALLLDSFKVSSACSAREGDSRMMRQMRAMRARRGITVSKEPHRKLSALATIHIAKGAVRRQFLLRKDASV